MKAFKLFTPTLIFLSVSSSLNASTFWNSNLDENLTNITKREGIDYFSSSVFGQPWAGIGPNGEPEGTHPLYYSRIPALTVTDDNKLVAMFDLRWNRATDEDRIDPGVAVSEDGGHSWVKKTAWSFDVSKHPARRAMDPTILHNPIDGSLYVMHGTWSSGTGQWYRERINHYNNNIWAATIYKSTDGGITWVKNQEFSRLSNSEIFSKVKRMGKPTIGFLGGVGSGIVMRDGTLVFPIQTAHENGIATTILYSKDNGKTWDMPATENAPAQNQSSLENMVFELEPGVLVMTGRETRVNRTQASHRWAYISRDMGSTWEEYSPAQFGSSTAQPTQGSSIYVTLPNGRKVLLVSKPNGNNDNWQRGNLALWMIDAKDPTHTYEVEIVRPGSGNAAGAGYSSLAYKEGNLFIAYEDDGDIRVKNLTHLLPEIEAKALEWNLPDIIKVEIDKINSMSNLNQGQKDELIAKVRKANDYAIAQSIAIDKRMDKIKTDSVATNILANQVTSALPSQRKIYAGILDYINKITKVTDTTYLDYNSLEALYANFYDAYLALSSIKLDFSKYTQLAKKFNNYNTDILYNSFDNIFAHYDSGTKHNNLSLGLNTDITSNLRAGVFFELRNKNQNAQQVGGRAKYTTSNHELSGFIRYRGVKHNEFLERNKNIDGYLNYAYRIQVSNELSISPMVGAYISRSSRTLIDEDVAVNKRTVYAGDLGVKISYKLGGISAYIRPNIAFVNGDLTLAQSNFATNTHKIKGNDKVYAVATGIEKRFANGIAVGSNLKLQRYGNQSSETNFSFNLGYNW